MTYIINTYKYFYKYTYITNGSIYERVCVCVLYVYKFLYVYMYSASSLWYIYNIYTIYTYLVFYVNIGITPNQQVRYLGTPIIRCPYQGCLSVLYIIYINIQYTYKTYDIDIVKEVSIHNTSYTIINIQCMGSLYRYNICV